MRGMQTFDVRRKLCQMATTVSTASMLPPWLTLPAEKRMYDWLSEVPFSAGCKVAPILPPPEP